MTAAPSAREGADRFDVVVLGAGPGGYVAAIRAAQLGLSAAVVEREYWGGVCLNVGCIPTKALLRNAELAQLIGRHAADFGIVGEVRLEYGAALARSRAVSEGRAKGVHYLMRKNGITQVHGHGSFVDDETIEVVDGAGVRRIRFGHAIVATGSEVRMLRGLERSGRVVTYEEQVLADRVPGSITIIGAGPIGVEFAYLLRSFGAEVTLIEALDRVLPLEDADVSKEIAKQLRRIGVRLSTGATVTAVDETDDAVTVRYADAAGTAAEVVSERVMVSIGFAPRVTGYGLEHTGVELTERGAIEVDALQRTSAPTIFAIGDVTGIMPLAHVAEAHGVVAAEVIAGLEPAGVGDHRMMPRATFCQPQAASFGLTEEQARDAVDDVLVATFPLVANGKAHALGDSSGFVKLIADGSSRTLVGGHLVGHDVSELLPELTLAQRSGLTIDELIGNVHTHPTLSEGIQEALHGLAGHMINL
ncbi:dihydrolipoyl dehydrogenase [Agromyces binzhouensis]|uniref:Dihydrolipoyl dehydrogenase n=1 Tax=Agromyces binzhouensis TaxID=1817495 RepID=A0A4Q2JXX0_9MICO|nr:dihydrolipoyl dehydrogenase [Agromyces binzhouensis]RXZ51667.1 dihydrolipoyl dehydrogenase [Agromyces binzhouensis]